MYKVNKCFTSKTLSASKGKIIPEIKNKKLAKTLLDAGIIVPISKQDISNAEKDKEIADLKATITKIEEEKAVIACEKEELEKKLEDLVNNTSEEIPKDDSSEENNSNKDEENKNNGDVIAVPEKNKKE